MTAIAGCVGAQSGTFLKRRCDQVLSDLSAYGDETIYASARAALFGARRRLSLPEDAFDKQPFKGRGGSLLFACDCRLDERSELAGRMGLTGEVPYLSDADLLFQAWERWGEEILPSLAGDFAIAAWDASSGSLVLARSHAASKPLFYHFTERHAIFGSMPRSLKRAIGSSRAFDLDMLASMASGGTGSSDQTIYPGVKAVWPGRSITWQAGRIVECRFAFLEIPAIRCDPLPALAEEFEHLLDQAVRARMRRSAGPIACELSGGRDSSAVLATAAKLVGGEGDELLALTHAPREGYDRPVFPDRIADESSVAAATAQLHPCIRHVVVRSARRVRLGDFTDCEHASQYPLGHLANMSWFRQLLHEAGDRGARVLLGGGMGNFTISAGGQAALAELLREEGALAWLRELRKDDTLTANRIPFVANSLIRAILPRGWNVPAQRIANRIRSRPERFPLLRQPYRERMEGAAGDWMHNFAGSFRELRYDALSRLDLAGKMGIGLAGVEERDPTADLRLVRFCLSLPAYALVDGRLGRPLYDRVFAGRVDPRVLRPTLRGFQGADWHEQFDVSDLRATLEDAAADQDFSDLFDVAALHRELDAWPTANWHTDDVETRFRIRLLSALSIGHFMRGARKRMGQ